MFIQQVINKYLHINMILKPSPGYAGVSLSLAETKLNWYCFELSNFQSLTIFGMVLGLGMGGHVTPIFFIFVLVGFK